MTFSPTDYYTPFAINGRHRISLQPVNEFGKGPKIILAVSQPANVVAQGKPAITGTTRVGRKLTASTDSITDADGLECVSWSYQWIRVDNDGNEAEINGATDSTYTLVADDEDKTLKVKVTFIDDALYSETLTSAATSRTTQANGTPAARDERPNTPAQGLPTISGEPHVMMELTASTSGITDADGLSGASYSYQWIRVDESTGVAVESEIERPWWRSELLVSPEFEGSKFKVQVSFTDDRGNSETLTSVATAQARDLYPPTNFDAVWTSQSDAVLTWQPPDKDRGEPILGYKYCYYHSDGSNAPVCKYTEGAPLTVTVSGLVQTGVRWQFHISAFDGMGSGMGRGIVPLPPAPPPPPPPPLTALTAEFRSMPVGHDGASRFGFELHFSENIPGLSYRTLRDSAFRVTNGSIAGIRRLEPGKNRRWRVTVRPAGTENVRIALPVTTDCRTTGALCSGVRPLSASLEAVVPGPPAAPPLTAAFRSMPVEHDGSSRFSFELHFSENVPGLSFRTLRDSAFTVTNGRVTGVRRLAQGSNRRWAVNVQPGAPETVTVHLPATTDCAGAGAICLPDGTKLSGALAATILEPPAASVADATAHEGTDATLDFVVTLTRATNKAVTVDYATSDGSATAGDDYTATRGTLTFASGERAKTVPVPVLDDAIDEGEETMRLTLSSPSGVKLGDAVATGTITNSDPLQKMWLSRFGRTVAGHVTDAVSDRLANPLTGAQVTVGGQRVDLAATKDEAWVGEALTSVARALGAPNGPEPGARSGSGPGQAGASGWPATGLGRVQTALPGSTPAREITGRELLLGSAFHLAAEGDVTGPGLAAWGRVTAGGFDGEAPADGGNVRIDGNVTTGILGADAEWNRLLAGVAVSVSEGEGTFAQPGVDSGAIESTMTTVSPYARLALTERVSAWGLAGWGTGDMTIVQAANDRGQPERVTRTDLEMRLAAAGGRGALLTQDEAGGIDLALKADAFYVETESEAVSNEGSTTGVASRVRLALEGVRAFDMGDGVTLRPSLELGLRHDGGDAETGAGVEIGGGVSYADPGSGLSVEAKARMLVAHAHSDYREWGASASVRLAPGERGRGLSFSLSPTLGAAASGADRLWGARDAGGLAPGGAGGFEASRGLNAELGYGLPLFGDRFTGTPNVGFALSDTTRDYRIGWRLTSAVRGDPGFEVNLDATRREPANPGSGSGAGSGLDARAEHGVLLRAAIRW